MANFFSYSLSLILLFPLQATSSSSLNHQHKLKTLHFSLFQHATANKDGYIVVKGVNTGKATNPISFPFGSIAVSYDSLTTSRNASSSVVGIVEATYVTSSPDGIRTMSISKFTVGMKNHEGSISILGTLDNAKPSMIPIVGGTEDFMFVQGYVTYIPVDIVLPTVVYKVKFHLFWPPYAAHV